MKILSSLEMHLYKQYPDQFIAWWYDESQPLNVRREDLTSDRYYELRREYVRYESGRMSYNTSSRTSYDIDKQKAFAMGKAAAAELIARVAESEKGTASSPGRMTAANRRRQTAQLANKKRRARLESGEPGIKSPPRDYVEGEAF